MDIGSRLELFVDDFLIERMDGVTQELHSPIPHEVVLELDRPWEGPISYDPVVILDQGRYRMWYRAGGDRDQRTAYAESPDGIHFKRVRVGQIEFGGTKDNNIVIDGSAAMAVCVFKDGNPETPDDERYKATGVGRPVGGRDTIAALASSDGLRWRPLQEAPILMAPKDSSPWFDSHNIFFWDNEKSRYAGYLRGWIEPGIRSIRWASSPDFRTWTDLTLIDTGDSPPEHLYKNACQPYWHAPHIYLMSPKRFVPERKAVPEHPHEGVSDAVFMSSRDGHHWDRRFMEAFLRPGPDPDNWTERNMYIGPNVVPTGPNEMSLYFVEHYRHASCRIRRGVLRTDGFVSIRAGYAPGELLTKPLMFDGGKLLINYATSAVGSVRVEIQDPEGRPFPGHTLDEADEVYGDHTERAVTWHNRSDVRALVGQPVRLRFVLKDVDLYALRFGA